jgi:hypothetical protein
MQVTVRWDNPEQTILRYDFDQNWTLTDFNDARKIGYQMIDTTEHQRMVGVLFVLPKRGVLPNNRVTNAMGQMKLRHQRTLMLVLVTENQYIKTLHNVLGSVYKPARETFLRANTLEEARTLILDKLREFETP